MWQSPTGPRLLSATLTAPLECAFDCAGSFIGVSESRPPAVWLPAHGHGAGILSWLLRDGEWWAHLVWVSTDRTAGYGEPNFVRTEACVHSSLIQPRQGYDYTHVPRYRV